jgi:hypothetical protein
MDIGCRQRDREDSGKCGTDAHDCSPHAYQPAPSTANTALWFHAAYRRQKFLELSGASAV